MDSLCVESQFAGKPIHRGSVAWILASLGALAVGVLAGAITANKRWGEVFPVAGFLGYVFAFRHALRLGDPEGLDLIWRSALGPRKEVVRDQPHRRDRSPSERVVPRVIRGEFPVPSARRRLHEEISSPKETRQ